MKFVGQAEAVEVPKTKSIAGAFPRIVGKLTIFVASSAMAAGPRTQKQCEARNKCIEGFILYGWT